MRDVLLYAAALVGGLAIALAETRRRHAELMARIRANGGLSPEAAERELMPWHVAGLVFVTLWLAMAALIVVGLEAILYLAGAA
jgi:hypothetical protein